MKGTDLSATSDAQGRFTLFDLPPGTYTLEVACPGYRTRGITDVVVSTAHPTQVQVALEEEAPTGAEVVVTASPFAEPEERVPSAYSMGYEEIRRAPGASGDVSRMMQSMPGVVTLSDQRNDLVVRGGSPSENLTVVDNVEVPNLNHFGTQGSTGGPISMLNTEFIQKADFLTGGFPALYGGKLSSVLNVSLREGNREKLSGIGDLGLAGAGLILEGPLGQKGSWMANVRRSYLDLIAKDFGLTAIPVYSNYLVKGVCDLDANHRIWLVALGGNDDITFKYDPEKTEDPGKENITSGGWRTATGLNWQMLWGSLGYGVFGIANTASGYSQEARDVDLGNQVVFENASIERMATLKYDAVIMPWTTDPTRTDPLFLNDEHRYTEREFYLQLSTTPLDRLRLTLGLRSDHFVYGEATDVLSPRISATYQLSPLWQIHASAGRFAQAQNRTIYDTARINVLRTPAYHRLDLRLDYRSHFQGWSLVGYVELQNVYKRENVFMYQWNEKTGQPHVVKQIGFFPVGGVKVEF